jgi:hypothetical protein
MSKTKKRYSRTKSKKSITKSKDNNLYILFITTHARVPILYNSERNSYNFDIKTSPINFNHIMAAPPGVCNYITSLNINNIFYKESNPISIINGLLKDFIDVRTMSLDKLSSLIKLLVKTTEFTPNYNNNPRYHKTKLNKFNDYGVVKMGHNFINKEFIFTSQEYISSNINDINIKLFKATPRGLIEEETIEITDFTKTPLGAGPNEVNRFGLLQILETLKEHNIFNVVIVDFTCSDFDYPHRKDHNNNNILSSQFNSFYTKT